MSELNITDSQISFTDGKTTKTLLDAGNFFINKSRVPLHSLTNDEETIFTFLIGLYKNNVMHFPNATDIKRILCLLLDSVVTLELIKSAAPIKCAEFGSTIGDLSYNLMELFGKVNPDSTLCLISNTVGNESGNTCLNYITQAASFPEFSMLYCDYSKTNLEDNCFDIVVINGDVCNETPDAVLKEAARITKPNGLLLCWTSRVPSLEAEFKSVFPQHEEYELSPVEKLLTARKTEEICANTNPYDGLTELLETLKKGTNFSSAEACRPYIRQLNHYIDIAIERYDITKKLELIEIKNTLLNHLIQLNTCYKKSLKTAIAIPWREGWSNVELTKDCGYIPFLLHKNHGMNVTMVGANTEPYPYLDTYVKGLNMEFLNEGSVEEKTDYIIQHAAEIDLLMLRGPYPHNFLPAIEYKRVNPKGKIYIGLDANSHWTDRILWNDPTFIQFMNCCDVIATSCRAMQKHLNEKWPWKIEYIPNGYYNYGITRPAPDFAKKENTILTVARLGTPQKCTDVLLNAFAFIADRLPDWKLKLVGSINPVFETYIKTFFEHYPQLASRIEFTGVISDKEQLFEEYQKAKIFALPSFFEGGTPNVIAEALTAGCATAVTKFDAWEDAIDDGRCGMACNIGDVNGFADILFALCTHPDLPQLSQNAYDYAMRNYNMETIVSKLHEMLFGEDF